MSNKHINVQILLLLQMLLSIVDLTGAQSIGVCYGRVGDNLPSPQDVISLYRANGITRMRVYYPNLETLEALRRTSIELVLGIRNIDIQSLATNGSLAPQWVQTYVKDYLPEVKFRYLVVGNEIDPNGVSAQYLLPAMENIYDAIAYAGLQNQIKVTTATEVGLLGNSNPPSQGSFRSSASLFIDPIINFLLNSSSPILVSVYPYFSYVSSFGEVPLSNALFTGGVYVQDGQLQYRNLFDGIVDAFYSALAKKSAGNLEIVVSESGWPSQGDNGATTENANTYYWNLINHVHGGTPKRPGRPIETYLYSMFDENLKVGSEIEQNFGLFYPNGQSKYPLIFNKERIMAMVCQ